MNKTTINDINYIEIDCMATIRNAKKEELKAEKYDCIQIGVKEVNAKDGYIIFKLLVPEKNILAYNNDKMTELKDNSSIPSLSRFLGF